MFRPWHVNDVPIPATAQDDLPAVDSPCPLPRPALSPPAAWFGPRFALRHTWLPILALALLLVVDAVLRLDQRFADALYAWEGHRWALKDAFATQQVLHRGGHAASLLGWCAVFAAWVWSLHSRQGHQWRKPLGYLALAALLGAALVAWIKSWSNMDCPWDLLRYGGDRPFVGLLDTRPLGLGRARCFPAAHASAGYAWLSLYFFLGVVKPGWRWIGLLAGLGGGLVFGVAQQLRGAHFLSHDLWALAICWFVALVLFRLFWPRNDSARWSASSGATR